LPYAPTAHGEGIDIFDYDPSTGRLRHEQVVRGIDSPSFVCVSPDGRSLYAASEVPERPEGVIGAYAVSPDDGHLEPLGFQRMGGAWASYLAMDPQGRALLLADYGRGRVALMPVRSDRSLGPVASAHQLSGTGPNAARQDGPHTHCIVVSPDGRFAFAADLGADRVFGYRLDIDGPGLVPHSELELPAGSGPRHLAFAPAGHHAYLVGELDSTLTVLAYDAASGGLGIVETHPLLPTDFVSSSLAADVQVHPSGRFLYASNRGHDSVAIFAVGSAGRLEVLGHRASEGRTPRNLAISPDGRYLLVGNQDSDTIVALPIDEQTRLPGPAVSVADVGTPACLVFGRF